VSYSLNLKKEFGIEHIILDGSTLIKLTLGLPYKIKKLPMKEAVEKRVNIMPARHMKVAWLFTKYL